MSRKKKGIFDELKTKKVTIKLYVNTEKHHKGVEERVPFVKLIAKAKGSERILWDNFKNWCFDITKAHTPTQRIYKFPDHEKVQNIFEIENKGRYLVVGKEYMLGKPDHKKRDYPICLKKERKEFLRANPIASVVIVPTGALRAEHVLGTIPDSFGSNPVPSQRKPSKSPEKKRTKSLLGVINPFRKRSKSPNAPRRTNRPPMLQRRASVSDMFKNQKGGKRESLGFLTRGFGTAHGIGYVPGLVDKQSVKKNQSTITLYVNTVTNDKGKTVDVDFHQIHRLGGHTNKGRFDYFLDWCKEQTSAATKIVRILRIPDHHRVRTFRGIKDGERYLLVGQEFLLQPPEHYSRDYPVILKEERKAYVIANPTKSVIKKPLIQQFVHNLTLSPKIVNIKIFINGMKGQKDPYELRFDTRKYSKHAEGAESGYDQMKKETFEKMQSSGLILHTPIIRFFEVPSHMEVKRVAEFSDKRSYLAVGREHLLYKKTNGCPDHDHIDYPSNLVESRLKYLLTKKMTVDKRVGRIESPGVEQEAVDRFTEEKLKKMLGEYKPEVVVEEENEGEDLGQQEKESEVKNEVVVEEEEEKIEQEKEEEEEKKKDENETKSEKKVKEDFRPKTPLSLLIKKEVEEEEKDDTPLTPSSLLEEDIRKLEEEVRKLDMDLQAEKERDMI